jgi:transposase
VASAAKDIQELLAEDEAIAALARQVIERHGAKHVELGVVPLIGRTSSFAVVLDMQTGEQLEIVDIDLYQLAIDKQAQPNH